MYKSHYLILIDSLEAVYNKAVYKKQSTNVSKYVTLVGTSFLPKGSIIANCSTSYTIAGRCIASLL